MHSYAIDTNIRQKVHVTLAVISMSIPSLFASIGTILGLPPGWGFPVTFSAIFGFLFVLFDRFLWKYLSRVISCPDLNGTWEATGHSSYVDPATGNPVSFPMEIRIKQTFSKMEIFTQTSDSTSRSTMASLCVLHAVPVLRYAFENIPKKLSNEELQRHPGMVDLRIEDADTMTGDYFSGKHRLRYGELTVRRRTK